MANKIECNCTLSIRLCGDGCKKCQPDTYIFNLEGALQSAEQEIEQLRSEIESLKKVPMFDRTTHKIVPIEPTYEMVKAMLCGRVMPQCSQQIERIFQQAKSDLRIAIESAPEYQESELPAPEGDKPCNTI